MALPLNAIAPAAAKSKPESEERLIVDIGTSLFALTRAHIPNGAQKG